MAVDAIPTSGYIQPSYETHGRISFRSMVEKKEGKRGKRPPSAPALRLRRTLQEKVQFLLDHQYPVDKYGGKAEQQRAFAKDSGVSWSTVQRALNPETGKTLDIIADLAVGFGIEASALMSFEPLDEASVPRRPFPKKPPKGPQPPRPRAT